MVIDFLKKKPAEGSGAGKGVAYFYFRRPFPVSLVSVVIALLDQLYAQTSTHASEVQELASKAAKSDSVTLFEATSSLLAVAGRLRRSFIIIDALDECPLSDQPELFDFLGSLKHSRARLFVTSRPVQDMWQRLGGSRLLVISVEQSSKGSGFETYLNRLLTEDPSSNLVLSSLGTVDRDICARMIIDGIRQRSSESYVSDSGLSKG